MFEYEIPVLHPVLVHFPVVLLLVTACIVIVWAVLDREILVRIAIFVSVFAAGGAFLARRTGKEMKEQSSGSPIVETLVDLHEQAAEWTLWMAAALAVCLLILGFGDRLWPHRAGTPLAIRAFVACLGLVAAALVLWTAHIGGIMVWGVAR